MRLILSNEVKDETITIEVSEDLSLQDFKVYVEAETGIDVTSLELVYNNQTMHETEKSLRSYGIRDGEIVLIRRQQLVQSNTQPYGNFDDRAELYRLHALNNDEAKTQLKDTYPDLHSVLTDSDRFKEVFRGIMESKGYFGHNEELMRLQRNPEDPQNQARILELIREEQIEANLQLAYDISPESFVSVTFLYIKLKINGFEAYALVDSGAQQTIIHPKLAEKFGLLNLIDKRFASMTIGVGTKQSAGRIHSVPVSLGETNVEVPCSFTVLETHIGILFGLDMLRRHKCSIDLSKDALLIGEQEVKFLSESEVERLVSPSQIVDLENLKRDQGQIGSNLPSAGASTSESNPTSTKVQASFPELSIARLTSLGFSEEEAKNALRAAEGNVEIAASFLFQ